eukprot:scaffold295_cov21-Tisochrysis_lutea.AAC.1
MAHAAQSAHPSHTSPSVPLVKSSPRLLGTFFFLFSPSVPPSLSSPFSSPLPLDWDKAFHKRVHSGSSITLSFKGLHVKHRNTVFLPKKKPKTAVLRRGSNLLRRTTRGNTAEARARARPTRPP